MTRMPRSAKRATALSVIPLSVTTTSIRAGTQIRANARFQVAGAYPSVRVDALLPGETTTITTLGMGSSARPYPFRAVQGRTYHARGEALAGQGLLDALHLQAGELVRWRSAEFR